MHKVRGNMTLVTGGASHIGIKGLHSGSTEVPMRKPRHRGRRFAAGRSRVGKSSRVAEQAGAGKRSLGTVLGPGAAKVGKRGRESALGRAAAKVGKGVPESVLGLAAAKVGKGGRESALGRAAAKVGKRVCGSALGLAAA